MTSIWKIWLDDVREVPSGFIGVKSVDEAKSLIQYLEKTFNLTTNYFILDLDHDLGDYAINGGDGIKLLDWLVETGRNTAWYEIHLHTANPVGRANMARMVNRYWE